MNDLNSFQDRLQYGKVAEVYAGNILTELGVSFQTSNQHWGQFWTNSLDKQYGDIVIHPEDKEPIWIDVKRNSIPQTSLDEFIGDYFWVFHHFIENYSILITKQELLSLDLPLHELASGNLGHKIKDIHNIDRSIQDLLTSK